MSPEKKNKTQKKDETELPVKDAAAVSDEAPAEEAAAPNPAAELQKKLDEQNDRYLRLLAEYDNYRKRTQAEKEGIYSDAFCTAISNFLPVFDNLDRAVSVEDAEGLKKGLELVLKQVMDIYEKIGVSEIPGEGEAFDPNLHNAVLHIEDEARGPGEIAEVFQKGYTLKGRVIRHSMVKVAN